MNTHTDRHIEIENALFFGAMMAVIALFMTIFASLFGLIN